VRQTCAALAGKKSNDITDMSTPPVSSLCFVAGKSGGHIIPCLTLATRHKNKHPQSTIIFFSTTRTLDASLVSKHASIDIHVSLPLGSRSYGGWCGFVRLCADFIRSVWCSFWVLYRTRPTRLISTGGVLMLAPAWCAWLLNIPVELYELNAVPGAAIKFFAPFATQVTVCFKKSADYFAPRACTYAAYPVRFERNGQQKAELNKQISSKKTVCILGGSQGSHVINHIIAHWAQSRPSLGDAVRIIHQTGSAEQSALLRKIYETHQIEHHVFTFDNSLEEQYQQADLIICRAGAGTLFEILFFEKPCITIPLETAYTNHQLDNATACAQEYPDLVTVVREQAIRDNQELLFCMIEKRLGVSTARVGE